MAVKRIVTPNRFIGGTGEQPTQATIPRVRVGDTFYDKDTGILYITYDGTNWAVKETKVNIKHVITSTTDGESAETAIATLAPAAAFKLLGVKIHFSGALAAAETLTVTRNSATDVYDTLLFTLDIGTTNIVDIKIPFGGEDDFYSATDEIVIALSANTANRVWGCETIHELV